MKKLLLLLVLFISATVAAQFDTGNNALNLPPVTATPPVSKPVPLPETPKKDPLAVPPSIFGAPSESKSLVIESENPFTSKRPEFVNPGDAVAKKLNESKGEGGNFKELRQNKSLGEFRIKSDKITIRVKDIGVYVDGEILGVVVNDKSVGSINVEGATTIFEINTQSGFNKIDVKVLNMGWAYPSSVYFEIVDGNGVVLASDMWFSETGFMSSIIVVKE